MNTWNREANSAWLALRIALGVGPVVAGLDKFFNLITNWEMYLSPLATSLLPVSPAVFMRAVGIIEIIVGLAVLTRWTRLGAYVASAWLISIAANLVLAGGFYDVAVRDMEIAVAAFALARLTEARERTGVRSGEWKPGSATLVGRAAALVLCAILAAAALSIAAAAETVTWKNVAVVDTLCASKAKAAPDKHTRTCALGCAGSGFGIVTESEREGDHIKAKSVSLD